MRADKPFMPLSDAERDQLEAILDALPPPLEPLDLSALDGFLVGVLLQPRPVTRERWLRHAHDLDGRAAPPGVSLQALQALVLRRHAELERAINARQWFDPWVFELKADADDDEASLASQAVLPWVAGFSAAQELFPGLLELDSDKLREPLAVLYAHFDPDDLESAEDLSEWIDAVDAPDNLAEAVQDLVRCTLLIADVSRPREPATHKR